MDPATRDGEDLRTRAPATIPRTARGGTARAHEPTGSTGRFARRKRNNLHHARGRLGARSVLPATPLIKLLGGDTECPLQVCLLRRCSTSTHFLSRSREAIFTRHYFPPEPRIATDKAKRVLRSYFLKIPNRKHQHVMRKRPIIYQIRIFQAFQGRTLRWARASHLHRGVSITAVALLPTNSQ